VELRLRRKHIYTQKKYSNTCITAMKLDEKQAVYIQLVNNEETMGKGLANAAETTKIVKKKK
jgi:hypothetical protein